MKPCQCRAGDAKEVGKAFERRMVSRCDVSKAAERSRSMRRLILPESAAMRRSLVSLIRAVPVLWLVLYAD